MTVREQILDVLNNSGPKTLTALVRILEEYDENNAKGNVHPVKSTVLRMLCNDELELTADCYLKAPAKAARKAAKEPRKR